MKPNQITAVLIGIIALALSACVPAPAPAVDSTQTFVAVVTETYLTLAPTFTQPVPIASTAPTETAVPTEPPQPTVQPTATPLVFADYQVLGVSYVEQQMMVSVSVGGISGEFHATLNDKEYSCFQVDGNQDVLYCIGAPVQGGSARLAVYSLNQPEPVMALDVFIPVLAATETPTPPPTNDDSGEGIYWGICRPDNFPPGCNLCLKVQTSFGSDEFIIECGFSDCYEMKGRINSVYEPGDTYGGWTYFCGP
jgi:hypothetical protein